MSAHTWFLRSYDQKQAVIDRVVGKIRKAHPDVIEVEQETRPMFPFAPSTRIEVTLTFKDKASLEAFKADHVMRALYTRNAMKGTRMSVKDLVVVQPRRVAATVVLS